MSDHTVLSISVSNLLLNLENYRFDPVRDQREALFTMVTDQGAKLVALAEDIATKGLNPAELVIVATEPNAKRAFIVLEGNRRVAALKLLSSPELTDSLNLPSSLARRWKSVIDENGRSVPREVQCVIMASEDAKEWINLKHTGENRGVGVVPWDGLATHRFRGSSIALQAMELVEKRGYLDADTKSKLPKIAITNIERVLSTPDARQLLGVDVQKGQLILVDAEEKVLSCLAHLVIDIANKRKKVTDLDTKEQRVNYAAELGTREPPMPSSQGSADGQLTSPNKNDRTAKTKMPADRKTLIPRKLKLSIPHTRINQIYGELQKLDINKFINSGAVLFRVFLELSITEYAKTKGIDLNKTNKDGQCYDLPLSQKILRVAKYLKENEVCTAGELQKLCFMAETKNNLFSIKSLNAYVHNQHYSPAPVDLKSIWDSIQAVIEKIWA